jgi:hypothetical protein
MNDKRMLGRTGCAFAVLALVGCSGGSGSDSSTQRSMSTLSVSLMDAPVDDVTAVYVQIAAMWIKPQGDGPAVQLPLKNAPLRVNLLELTDKNAAILIDEAVIEPGSYEWLAMDIDADPNIRDSYVMTQTGGEEEIGVEVDLFVPSGRLRLVGGFDVPANEAVHLLFDWDMRKGLVHPPGLGRYLLKPAFRMLDVTAYGVLEGTIDGATVGTDIDPEKNDCAMDDEDLTVGNVVYVFEHAMPGDTVTPDDIDGVGDPVVTVEATLDVDDYVYRTLLEPGTYTVVFSCNAGNDDPVDNDDEEISFLDPVGTTNPIEIGANTTTVDF